MKYIIAVIVAVFLIAGCTPLEREVAQNQFDSEQELLAYLSDLGTSTSGQLQSGSDVAVAESAAQRVASDSAVVPAASSRDFSETNVQVAGIDEADLIKTDGEYIYTISGNTLFIIKAYPGEDAEIVSRISFNHTQQELFIYEDTLVVFGTTWEFRSASSQVHIYDISNRENPVHTNKFILDGSYFRSRMIDGKVYVVTTQWPSVGHPMPFLRVDGVERTLPIDRIFFFPSDNPMYVNIHSFDVQNPELESIAILVEGTEQLYMSENAIYISYTEYINEYTIQQDVIEELVTPLLSSQERDLIRRIQQTDSDILSESEKHWKIQEVYQAHMFSLPRSEQESLEDRIVARVKEILDSYDALEFTHIHKIALDPLEPVATGSVPGRIINQFALDEHQDVLRIATTTGGRWMQSGQTVSANHVYALDSNLNIIGRLEDLAEKESIFATRFVEDRLYMITFEEIDPFFVIDLSDPTNIRNLGELKIPGFSRYLHPYNDDIIIGIGHQATEQGRITGLKVSLFDVSDVNNPIELTNYVTDERYAHSTALFEHRAFLFSKEKNLLVIPIVNYGRWDYGRADAYTGAFVFHITESDVSLRGLVEHSAQVERSLYIEDLLYTKSYSTLRINRIDTLVRVKDLSLTQASDIPIY